MLDINLIREKAAFVTGQLAKRGHKVDFAAVIKLDDKRKKEQKKVDDLRADRNRVSQEVSNASSIQKAELVLQAKNLGEQIEKAEVALGKTEKKIYEFMVELPNIPLHDVQAGGKEENLVKKTFGEKPEFDFEPKTHMEICSSLGLVDYERAARMAGANTWIYTDMGARLEWALLNYFVDFHIANGYTFVMPPHLLNHDSGYISGQFPKFQDDVFTTSIGDRFRFLIPTSETAVVNMHKAEIIEGEKLPIKYAAMSPCYRKEAGGYGANERGMIRGHQFNKVEMFIFCKCEDSPAFFDELLLNAEKLVEGLGLHYQTVALAAGDISHAMSKTYDIEVFIPSIGYKEVSSVSNAGDYQSRRAGIRTKVIDMEGKPENRYVHTLNASGLATSRIIPAIVEQFQTAEGRVRIPEVLQKYLGGVKEI